MDCDDGLHTQVVLDKFGKLPGVKRYTPGDCYCLACKQPIAAWWNAGRPVAIDEPAAA